MSETSSTLEQVKLRISPDDMHVALQVSRGMAADEQLVQLCLSELRDKQVQITRAVEQLVAEQLRPLHDSEVESVEIELRGTPPKPGEDGRLEWAEGCAPHDKRRPTPSAAEARSNDDDQAVDFYNQRAFITVSAGQRIVRIVPPTGGACGTTLRGKELAAKPGQAVKIRLDPNSVASDPDGHCTALIDGLLKYDGQKLSVSPQLEIHGYVDFSTGNVDFQGDVQINKGIRDCFHVKARGTVVVDGPIESAAVHTGGHLHANRGIACHGASSIIVGGDLHARYMDTAHVSVRASAHIEREIIQCTLSVGDSLLAEHGALIGGVTCVCRKVRLASLGSDAEVPTRVYLAYDPAFEQTLRRTRGYLADLRNELKSVDEQLAQINAQGAGGHSADTLTDLMCRQYNINAQLKRLAEKYEKLDACYQTRRRVDIEVTRAIHAGVRLIIDDTEYRVAQALRGPVWIGWNNKRRLFYRVGEHGATTPLGDVAGLEIGPARSSCPDMQPPQTLQPPDETHTP